MERKEAGQDKASGKGGFPTARLLPQFIGQIKLTLGFIGSIRNIAQLSRGRFKDPEFEHYFQHLVAEETAKIESVLNVLVNFMKISSPVVKSNTIHSLLDEALDAIRESLQEKSISQVKEFYKDLPETIVHEVPLRFILSSVLQYAVSSAMPKGTIGIWTRSVAAQADKASGSNGYIEIVVGFTGYQKPMEPTDFTLPGASILSMEKSIPNDSWRLDPQKNTHPSSRGSFPPGGPLPISKEDPLDLVLKLVQEIVQKNRGTMTFDADEKKLRTYISLTLPIERRKVFFFPKRAPAPPPRSF